MSDLRITLVITPAMMQVLGEIMNFENKRYREELVANGAPEEEINTPRFTQVDQLVVSGLQEWMAGYDERYVTPDESDGVNIQPEEQHRRRKTCDGITNWRQISADYDTLDWLRKMRLEEEMQRFLYDDSFADPEITFKQYMLARYASMVQVKEAEINRLLEK